jgi:hypothetical protein
MPAAPQFHCGPSHATEWHGLWKATPEASPEWDDAWASLKRWLSRRYVIDWQIKWQRHCCVDRALPETERTLKIIIEVADVLSVSFLVFVQQWLREQAPLCRVAVPVDNTDQNLILIYPEAIRINEPAEANLGQFIESMPPQLTAMIENGFQQLGLRPKPIPPLP